MKMTNYRLQTEIESLSSDKSQEFFTEYIRSIIQDFSKPYYQRTDYVGLSLQEVKSKIDTLAQDIRELQQLKTRLSDSLDIAKEITANVLLENGIDRMDGNIISSLTLTKESSKTKTTLKVLDTASVMRLGYIKYEPDLDAIEQAMKTQEGLEELDAFVSIASTTETIPSKIKVNTKRIAFNQATELLNLVDAQAA